MSDVGFEADRRNTKAFKLLNALIPRTRIAIRNTWFAVGLQLDKEARKEINRKPKSGRTYFIRVGRSKKVRRHIASAPGETHANRSYKLRNSVSWKVHGSEMMEFGYGFSTTASNKAPFYDSYVEDGTSKMKPRPSIGNAVAAVKGTVEDRFQKEMLAEFKRAE